MHSRLIRIVCLTSLIIGARVGHAQPVPEQVKLILIDGDLREDWPDRGHVAVRRSGNAGDLTVSFGLTGTAKKDLDYHSDAADTLVIPDGERESWIEFTPLPDTLKEVTETIVVTLLPGSGYTVPSLAADKTATLRLGNASSKPGSKAAARFLTQAAFGPSSDSTADADIIPQNVQTVMSMGIPAWIEDQFKKPLGLHQPHLDYLVRAGTTIYGDHKAQSWWRQVMGVGTLYPGARAQASDPLRQRVAFALSQIFVISDNVEELYNQPRGMANYYDVLVRGAFGNFRDLLFKVSTHPCMGVYLSHLKNRKADPVAGTFPDENYAREVMQLFSIGLWELNPDGTRKLDGLGQPIPTYDNEDITNFARVFTGMSYGGTGASQFWWPPQNYTVPMKMWDQYHDLEPKTLLNGVTLPARTASNPDKGTACLADVNAAIDCLFNHPNTGPFICKQLIQRFVTSNPSPAYVGRVAAAFANNGRNVRGDMKAVVRAMLLDDEARNPAQLASPSFGKLKEPYLRTVNLARAFNARSTAGHYRMAYLGEIHFQQPLSSPSVFNFFRPGYSPAGPLSDEGLLAPEFQIMNAISALSLPNYYFRIFNWGWGFNRWGDSNAAYVVRAQISPEKALYNNVPALLRRLDLVLTGGTLPPQQHELIRDAVESINSSHWDWINERIYMAIYLVASTPEAAILR
mgnify:CR=1 FL=1